MSQSQPEVVVHIPHPHDHLQEVAVFLDTGSLTSRVTTAWGTVADIRTLPGVTHPVKVTVRPPGRLNLGSDIYIHCDRVTSLDPILVGWQPSPEDAAELASTC